MNVLINKWTTAPAKAFANAFLQLTSLTTLLTRLFCCFIIMWKFISVVCCLKYLLILKSLNTGLFVFHWICYVLLSLLKKRIVPSAIIWIHLKARYKILLMHLVLWRMFLQNIALELYLKFVSSWLRINIYSKSPFGKTRVKIMCTIWQFSTQRWG